MNWKYAQAISKWGVFWNHQKANPGVSVFDTILLVRDGDGYPQYWEPSKIEMNRCV